MKDNGMNIPPIAPKININNAFFNPKTLISKAFDIKNIKIIPTRECITKKVVMFVCLFSLLDLLT